MKNLKRRQQLMEHANTVHTISQLILSTMVTLDAVKSIKNHLLIDDGKRKFNHRIDYTLKLNKLKNIYIHQLRTGVLKVRNVSDIITLICRDWKMKEISTPEMEIQKFQTNDKLLVKALINFFYKSSNCRLAMFTEEPTMWFNLSDGTCISLNEDLEIDYKQFEIHDDNEIYTLSFKRKELNAGQSGE